MTIQFRSIYILAKDVCLAAIKGRLGWLFLIMLILCLSLATFVGHLALIQNQALKVGVLSSALRLATLFLLTLFIVNHIIEEQHDKRMALFLSLPLSRADYWLGKLLGCVAIIIAMTSVITILIMHYTLPLSALIWGGSLFCELLLMSMLALFAAHSLGQTTAAVSVLLAFYLLSRTLSGFVYIAENRTLSLGALDQWITSTLKMITFVVPATDQFTRSQWLINSIEDIHVLLPILIQTLIYGVLLGAASLIDLQRKNI